MARRTIRPSSRGGPAQRKAATVMKEPLSSSTFTAKTKKGKLKQRFAIAQSMARRAGRKRKGK
jgi:hypothetical protein